MNFNLDEDDLPMKGFNKYEYFDWYDYAKVEKLNESRSKQWLKLYVKLKKAKESGDESALAKAREAMRKHEADTQICKRKAEEAGHYWC